MFLDVGIHTSWATLREELTTHQVVTVVLPTSNGDMLKIRRGSTPEPRHKEIYETLRIQMEAICAMAKEDAPQKAECPQSHREVD